MPEKSTHKNLELALKDLLLSGQAGTQEEICSTLNAQGFNVNQSKVSRLLRKIAAIKVKNPQGHVVYTLAKEPPPPSAHSPLSHLVLNIRANDTLIIITTSPGAAPLIARMLDFHQQDSHILGTIAGDDTIFVAPEKTDEIREIMEELKRLLS